MENKTLKLFFLLTILLVSSTYLFSKEYYLATDGKDSNPGTLEKPFGTLEKAISMLEPGDICYVRGGTYYQTSRVFVTQTGTKDKRICLFAYEDEKPIFDWSNGPQNKESSGRGIEHAIGANYWHYKGLEICYAGDNGMKMEGSYCVIEQCVFHHNRDTGLQLGFGKDSKGNNTRNPDFIYGRYNIILNCDSYSNYDILPGQKSEGGGDADGFAVKLFPGPGNEFHGCRSWLNSDDGWDFYYVTFPIVVHNCWTMKNGYDKGNGNGFKMGGFTENPSYGAHIFMNCVSLDNKKKGFDQNNHTEGSYMFNCIAAGNGVNYQFDNEKAPLQGKWILRNCVGSHPTERNHKFVNDDSTFDIQYCSWNIFDDNNIYSDANKRIYTNYSSEYESLSYDDAIASRQANGELPLKFARLNANSKFIDQGAPIDNFFCENYSDATYNSTITIPFLGTAPDLGAFEYGDDDNKYVLIMPENDGTVPEEEPKLSEWRDEEGNYYAETILFDWYNFQESTLPDMISVYQGNVEPAYADYNGATINTVGVVSLTEKGVSYVQLDLPSLRDLKVITYARGKREITVKYKKEGASQWSTLSSVSSFAEGSNIITLTSETLKTKHPISVQIVNSREGGGNLRISDLYVSGYEQVEGDNDGDNDGDDEDNPTAIDDTDASLFDMYQTETALIVYGEIASLDIVSQDGKIVSSSQNMQVVSTASLNKGIYIVLIQDKVGKKVAKKFNKSGR